MSEEYKFDRNYLKLLIDNKDKLIEVPINDVKLILTYCEILLDRQDKAIEILKNKDYIDNLLYIDDEVSDKRKLDYWFEVADKLDDKRLEALAILGDKE